MTAFVVVGEVTVALPGARQPEAGLELARVLVERARRQVDFRAVKAVRADGRAEVIPGLLRWNLGQVVHHPAKVADAVEQRARTAQHLDALDVHRIRRRLPQQAIAQGAIGDETADLDGGLVGTAGGALGVVRLRVFGRVDRCQRRGQRTVVLRLQDDAGRIAQGLTEIQRTRVADEVAGDDLER